MERKREGSEQKTQQSSTQCTEYHTVTCMDTCVLLGVYVVAHLICSRRERYFSLYSFLSLSTRATSSLVRPSGPT